MSLLAKKQLINIFRSCHKDIKLNVVFKTLNRLRNASVTERICSDFYIETIIKCSKRVNSIIFV